MPSVKVKENEPFDVAMRRFKRACEKAGVMSEVRRREYYEKPSGNASARQPPQSSGTSRSVARKPPVASASTESVLSPQSY